MQDDDRALGCVGQVLNHAIEVQADRLGIKVAVVLPLHPGVSKNVPAPSRGPISALLIQED